MTGIPDLNDPRYLDEIGWFLYHEKYGRDQFGGSYDAERRVILAAAARGSRRLFGPGYKMDGGQDRRQHRLRLHR